MHPHPHPTWTLLALHRAGGVMMPSFLARRVRWTWLAAVGTAVWINRRDAARWLGFARRSIEHRDELDLRSWLTEARVRAAVTIDPVLRCDPGLDDVVVDDGKVRVRTNSESWPDAVTHLNGLRKVKGVDHVSCEAGALVGGVRINADGTPTV